jgi:hypothetical protein
MTYEPTHLSREMLDTVRAWTDAGTSTGPMITRNLLDYIDTLRAERSLPDLAHGQAEIRHERLLNLDDYYGSERDASRDEEAA